MNIGLVAGGLAISVMIVWVGTALTLSTVGSRAAKNTAADSLRTVTNLAITAQQAGPTRRCLWFAAATRNCENARTSSASTICVSSWPNTWPARTPWTRADLAQPTNFW